MNTWKFVRSIVSGRRFLVLLAALLLVVTQATNPALGMRPGGDPTDTDPIGVGNDPPQYVPPAGGFSWSMEKRFGPDLNGDGMVDYHWTPDGYVDGVWVYGHYDPAYIYPTSWKITFNGCQTGNDNSNATTPYQYEYDYYWTLGGAPMGSVRCKPTVIFTDKAPHEVGLTVIKRSDDSTTVFPIQTVQVKDYFIVSLGDSYASGQGNPDIEQEEISGPFGIGWIEVAPAQWQDLRCHRSANAAPALAALALEASDPHSSVTFISFACTGATIKLDSYDLVPQFDADPLWENRGSGILGPHRGEITDVAWGDFDHYIKPQMQQLEEALAASNGQASRQIDALLISGGGNDMKFGPLIRQCTIFTNCWVNWWAQMAENPVTDTQWYTLYDLVTRAVGKWTGANPPLHTIPASYAEMGARINSLNPRPLHVYVTQYPDPTINDRGVANEANETYQHHCRMLDDVVWPNPVNVVTDVEAQTASHHAQAELNEAVRNSVANLASTYPGIDWQFVDGLSAFDVDPNPAVAGKPGLFKGGPNGGPGHGYCATDNWIRRADESELIQGPVNWRKDTVGTMHPTYTGQQMIKSRIMRYMLPDLTGQSQVQAPSFSFSYSSGGLTSQPGLNGWYLRSCDISNNCLPRVVGQAVATSAANLNGASISVNDTGGCAVEGVTCTPPALSPDQKQVTYAIEINATGTYRFRFTAQDVNGLSAFLQKEIKVDLEDPVLATPIGPFEVDEGSSVQLSAQVATVLVGDPPQEVPINEDVVVNYDWDLDNDGIFEMEDEQPTFSAAEIDGPATQLIRVKVTDRAGRTATAQSEVHVLHVGPPVAINGAPATSPEGTAINLTSMVNSTLTAPFSYAWEVKKNGAGYVTGANADLSFIPNDNGSYEVSLAVTKDGGSVGTASLTIDVTNVAPTVAFNGAPATSPEGTEIVLTATVSDPGAADSLTYAWEVKKNGSSYKTGQAPEFRFTPDDNGPYEVTFHATDDDGGMGSANQTIAVTNVVPAVAINGTPATSLEGTAISLTSQASDPGAADTFAYAWEVKKNGSSFKTGSEAGFSFTPDDDGSYEVSLQVTDDDGGAGTAASQAIDVTNVVPIAAINGAPVISPEGTAINVTKAVSDPGAADTFSYAWEVKKDGSSYKTGSEAGFSFTPDDNASYELSLQVTDDDGGVGTTSQTIDVLNVPPVLDEVNYSPTTVNEGDSITVSGGIGDPGTMDTLTLEINWGDGSLADTQELAVGTTSFTASHIYADDNPTGTASDQNAITVKITDKDSGSNSDTGEATVVNLDPSLSISGPESGALYAVNSAINLSAALTDPSTLDTLSCTVDWGDGATETGTQEAEVCTASHVYTAAGVYTIQMTGADDDTGVKTESVMVVVYDPSAGFVTGGGWINSPAGAYKVDESLSGKATFGFVSKYQKGASVPTGNTAFKFQAGSFEFYSTAYEWLVVNQGGTNAQFKGSGTVNGALDPNGNTYKFMLWASDGSGANGADTFRIRIWWEDAAGEHEVYDNGVDQAIGGGSIVVHTSK